MMALVIRSEVKDVTTLLTMAIKGYVAWDKRRGIHIVTSHGRRVTGRPRRYYVIVPTEYADGWQDWKRYGLTAYDDKEARAKAIERIKKGK
jgi:hypothetical protein